MSMSTHVVGCKPPDERWEQMKAIWDACASAQVDIPDEVEDFFEGTPPDVAGVRINLKNTPAAVEWTGDMAGGWEIYIDKLPKDVKIVRVYNSY